MRAYVNVCVAEGLRVHVGVGVQSSAIAAHNNKIS